MINCKIKKSISLSIGTILLSTILVGCNSTEFSDSSVSDAVAVETPPATTDITIETQGVEEYSPTENIIEDYSNIEDNTPAVQDTTLPAESTPEELTLSGKWYNEKDDILYDLQPNGVLYVTEHDNSFEQKYEITSNTVIDGLDAETPVGYEGIFIHYYDTGEPDPWAYYFEDNDTMVMSRMRARSSVHDEPDALPDHIELKSTLTFIRQS